MHKFNACHHYLEIEMYIMSFLIAVVGEKESSNGTVNVRTRDNKVHGERSVAEVIARFQQFRDTRCLDAEDIF